MIRRIVSIHLILLSLLIFSSCDKEVSISGPKEYEYGNTSYAISTYPQGAAIFIDGKYTGKFSPDTINYLTAKMHTFVLKLAPFMDYTFSDSSVVDKILSKEYDFFSDMSTFGTLILESNPPGCTIYLNDKKLVQETPEVLANILPGVHKIKFTFPEHRADSTEVYLLGGKALRVKLELQDTSVWVTYTKNNSYLTDNTIRDILFDNTNTMWLATSQNGVIKISGSEKTFFTKENSSLPSNNISRLKEDKNGNIWVSTFKGLSSITNNVITTYSTDNSNIPGNFISDVAFDNNNNIWVGTDRGLTKFDGSNWTIFNTSNSEIPSNFIKSIFLMDENFWIGTYQSDAARIDNNFSFKVYPTDTLFTETDTLFAGNAVFDIIHFNNKLIFGFANQYMGPGALIKPGGLFTYNTEMDSIIKFKPSFENISIRRFFNDNNSTLWIATESGAIELKSAGDYKIYNKTIKELATSDIITISKDKYGNMWFGTESKGLVKYKIWKN